MDEVSDGSNTSAPDTFGQLRLRSQQGPSQSTSSGRDSLDDRVLTVSSADDGHALASSSLPSRDDGGATATALGGAATGATELRISGGGVSSPGMATDQDLTITDSSASHLGETLPSEPVTAPVFNEPHTSRQASTLTSPADHPVAANDMNDALGPPAPWHDSGSGAHRNGGSSSVADQGHGAGSSGTFNPSQHADRLISSTLDVLPLDDVIDPAPHHDMAAGDHHNAPANDDAKPPHADVSKAGDLSKSADALKTADPLKSDDAANSGADVLATHKAPATPSTGEMVEAGTKAILLATDESPSGIGPHASAADFAPGAAQGHVHSSAHATTAFSPGVIGARDQLASAIATATPEAAAITTLPSAQITDGAPPTLGGDMHALQKHAA